jgi:hypothetical protein
MRGSLYGAELAARAHTITYHVTLLLLLEIFLFLSLCHAWDLFWKKIRWNIILRIKWQFGFVKMFRRKNVNTQIKTICSQTHTHIFVQYTLLFSASQRVSVLLAYQHVMEQNTQLHLQAGISMLYVLRAWMS